MEYVHLIDQAVLVTHKKEMDEHLVIFQDRYRKMIEYLENLRNTYMNKTLNNKNICLNIVRMIDHEDDDELQNAIVAVNNYYQNNIYKES